MRLHACHGVMAQERIVGNDYVVNVGVDYPVEKACESDAVSDALNYAVVADIVREQMAQPSNLLENVAWRIAQAISQAYPLCGPITVDIRKLAPPMSVDSDGAGVRITL